GALAGPRRADAELHLETCDLCLAIVGAAASVAEQTTPAAAPPSPARPAPAGRTERRAGHAARAAALAAVLAGGFAAVLLASRAGDQTERFPHDLAAYRDEGGSLSAAAVAALPASAFTRKRPEHANFGFTQAAIWLRVSVHNPDASPHEVVLDAAREWVDEVDL